MNETSKKENTVLLTIITVSTLLVAVIGATFAYFTSSVMGNSSASSIIVKTPDIGNITYKAGNQLSLQNALPGDSKEITFSITAPKSTNAVPYAINWTGVSNNFSNSSRDLVYTLTTTDTSDSGHVLVKTERACPTSGTTIGSGSIAGGATHNYKLKVTFKETYSDQNSDQGKQFYGTIQVTTGGSTTLYYNSTNSTGTSTQPKSS